MTFPLRSVLCALLAAGPAAQIHAEATICADPLLTVVAADTDGAERICASAMAAKRHLARCGLPQSRPVTIELRARIEGPASHCAGIYLCGEDRIALVTSEGAAALMPEDSIFAALPPETYHNSLIVHELAHALMEQAECSRPRCDADKEYVAYALQIDSLPADGRAAVAAWREVARPVETAALNDFLLFFKPDVFAAHAWAHFDDDGGGCALVQKQVAGETTLALPVMDN